MAMTELLFGFLFGVSAFFLAGLVIGSLPSERLRGWLADAYWAHAMRLSRRALLYFPVSGTRARILASRRDTYAGGERATVNGQEKTWVDPSNRTGEVAGRAFGIVDGRVNQVLAPRDIRLGAALKRRKEEGLLVETKPKTVTHGGEKVKIEQDNIEQYVPVDDGLVPIRQRLGAVDGSADPKSASRVRTWVELSQTMYRGRSTLQYVLWLLAFGAGVGAVLVGGKITESGASGAGGGGVSLPFVAGRVVELVVMSV